MITAETLFDKIAKTGFLNYKFYLDNWEEMLSEMSLVGTVENRDKFLYNLSVMLKEDGYPSYMENKIWNKTFIDVNYFKSNLSKNDIEKIQNDNIYDNEIYQYLKVRNK